MEGQPAGWVLAFQPTGKLPARVWHWGTPPTGRAADGFADLVNLHVPFSSGILGTDLLATVAARPDLWDSDRQSRLSLIR